MATHRGMSASTVQRIWREHRPQPPRESTFKFSNDQDLEAKVTDIVGLYRHPPEKALVLCVDAKTMIQALHRAQPLPPMKPGSVTADILPEILFLAGRAGACVSGHALYVDGGFTLR